MKNEMYPEIISDNFTQRINNHYNLRHINHFDTPFVRTVFDGTKSDSILDLRFGTLFQKNIRH